MENTRKDLLNMQTAEKRTLLLAGKPFRIFLKQIQRTCICVIVIQKLFTLKARNFPDGFTESEQHACYHLHTCNRYRTFSYSLALVHAYHGSALAPVHAAHPAHQAHISAFWW